MAEKPASKPNLLIWGTCISRDPFRDRENTIGFTSRSSLATLAACPTEAFDERIENLEGVGFFKRCAINDSRGNPEFRQNLADADYLIMDLAHEHRGFFINPATYSILTDTALLRPLHRDLKRSGYRFYHGGWSRGRTTYFMAGVKALKEMLKDFRGRVVLNQAYFGHRYDDGSLCPLWTYNANRKLRFVYDLVLREIDFDLVVTYTPDQMVARKHGHQWGRAPYHFTDKFYEILPRELEKHFGGGFRQS